MRTDPTLCWAITGPTGAGKSLLCGMMVDRGAQLIEADRVAHALLDGPSLQRRLVDSFGVRILGGSGRIDRAVLGSLVFKDPAARERLDALVHPPLSSALAERLEEARFLRSDLVILEAAVYFLLPGPPRVDWTIAVVAPRAIRLARLVSRGMDRATAEMRLDAQAHLEPTWVRADHIINNDGAASVLAAEAADLWRTRVAPRAQDGDA